MQQRVVLGSQTSVLFRAIVMSFEVIFEIVMKMKYSQIGEASNLAKIQWLFGEQSFRKCSKYNELKLSLQM